MSKRTQASIAPSSGTVVVIAGGTEFFTSRETLEQGGRGYLAARLQHGDMMEANFGRGQQLPFMEVDRCPDLFRIVLASGCARTVFRLRCSPSEGVLVRYGSNAGKSAAAGASVFELPRPDPPLLACASSRDPSM